MVCTQLYRAEFRNVCSACRDMRQNKGSILKASVDYIKKLKRDSEQLRMERDEKSQLEKNFQKLQLKFTVSIFGLYVYLCFLVSYESLV